MDLFKFQPSCIKRAPRQLLYGAMQQRSIYLHAQGVEESTEGQKELESTPQGRLDAPQRASSAA
jgi:hypothetical protein